MKTIQSEWENYWQSCIPANASEIQIKESKQAFYAGGMVVFTLLNEFSIHGEETACKMLDTLNEEILEFFK